MNVGAQPHVERQIPADVVRVVVNHDLVIVPQPVVAEAVIIRGNAEIETAEPEAVASSTAQPPNVAAANSSRKVPVLPRVIEVVVGVPRTGFVSDPFAVGVNVRSIRVPGRIAIVLRLRTGRCMRLTL